ncbi:hypothetical protein DI09_29p190 [Mitosporidium daphniae]|uniref:Uncharacterized protein n=1 Tax=Mitosporidium daphniae TaxID=1485682 RepID=A0A098VRL5_9MICR|nr:uncharacterized protein DI09_29p190 [Mitosporidium daphniae]KGG51698.1 hypothetical protein DI09_29p190 [Mitosporidium daphniae]|eukprot:XP_013238125.1 uncharacterized protein DI09_29p190 [Mitosporidium daphniae]
MSAETQAFSSHDLQGSSPSPSNLAPHFINGFSDKTGASQTGPTTIMNGINQLKKQGEKMLADHVPTTEALGKYIKSIHDSINTPLVPSTNYWLIGYKALEKLGSPLFAAWGNCTTPTAKVLMLLLVGMMFWMPLLLFFWLVLLPSVSFLTLAYILLFGKRNLQLHLEETFTYATGLTVKVLFTCIYHFRRASLWLRMPPGPPLY